jgi:M6 family metalloprotease-like protein
MSMAKEFSWQFLFCSVLWWGVVFNQGLLVGRQILEDPPEVGEAGEFPGEADCWAEFRTVNEAIPASPGQRRGAVGVSGYLGVQLEENKSGWMVAEIAPQSPAELAGFAKGDVVRRIENTVIENREQFRNLLKQYVPGESVSFQLEREQQPIELTAILTAVSRPVDPSRPRPTLGVRIADQEELDTGLKVEGVGNSGGRRRSPLQLNDILLTLNGTELASAGQLEDLLWRCEIGEKVTVKLLRNEVERELEIELTADVDSQRTQQRRRAEAQPSGSNTPTWRSRGIYRLAVVCVEFPDVKHNPKITSDDWQQALFSEGSYANLRNATGQPVFGSLRDYYLEQSVGALKVEGKIFDWVEVSKKRDDYAPGTGTSNKTLLLREAIDLLTRREGNQALSNFDGLFFLYAGARARSSRGGLYWPHKGNLTYANQRWNYFISPEGGPRKSNISVICHEFGHMLGLPDLYARPENPDSMGASVWCAMSNQLGNGRPQHFSAWCKERLGWLKPVVIDPTVPQKLILAPVENSNRECFKVLVRPDGSEYLLLENRRRLGFDEGLPGEGLLIWRVVNNRPMIHVSHGISGPSGPGTFRDIVPYPSSSNDSFTPYTTPSSRSYLGGGLPVHITNIRELEDGRISFFVGYEFD